MLYSGKALIIFSVVFNPVNFNLAPYGNQNQSSAHSPFTNAQLFFTLKKVFTLSYNHIPV